MKDCASAYLAKKKIIKIELLNLLKTLDGSIFDTTYDVKNEDGFIVEQITVLRFEEGGKVKKIHVNVSGEDLIDAFKDVLDAVRR